VSQILVRELSPETVLKLKERAKRSRRSLQAEVRGILEEAPAAFEKEVIRKQRIEEFLRFADWVREQSGPQTSDSVDLIREDRDR
jgi:plasmid stability protein